MKLWYIEQRSPVKWREPLGARVTRYIALAEGEEEALGKAKSRAAHAEGEWQAREYGADVVPLGMVRLAS